MRSVAALPSLALTLLAVPLLSACSALGIPPLAGQDLIPAQAGSSADPGATPLSDGSTPVTLVPTFFSTSDGYAMTLPPGWGAVRVAANAGAAALDVLSTTDPGLAGFARDALATTGARISMVGGDLLDTGLAIPPGVLCLVMQTHGAADAIEAIVQQEIATSPALDGSVSHTVVTVPAGDAHRFEFQVRGSGAPVHIRAYLFEVGAEAVVLAFGASAPGFDSASPSFDAIIKSLRFGV